MVRLSRDKNGRMHVPGDRVTRTGLGCFGFVAKDERAANMFRDNPVEPERGRWRTGSEVVVSGDQGEGEDRTSAGAMCRWWR